MNAQPPAPVILAEPTEVAEGIYAIPDHGVPLVPNVGIVVGSRATLVIDTGMGPQNGDTVRRHAEELGGGSPMFLTITHFHPEHGYGAQAFADAAIVYNREQLEELRQKGQPYLEMFRTFGEPVAEQLEGVALVEPHVTYDGDAAEVLLGGHTARLRTWGLAHTRADQIVFLPEQRVLFTGDLVENNCFAIFPWFPPEDADVDGDRWVAVLEQLERLEPAVVVPGHGEIGNADVIATAREYLQLLRSETRRIADEGASEDETAEELDRAMRELHPDWAQPEWIASGARCFYATYAAQRDGQR